MNRPKYFLINDSTVIGKVYESEKYGRTLVLDGSINPEYPIEVLQSGVNEKVNDIDLIELLHSLIPIA